MKSPDLLAAFAAAVSAHRDALAVTDGAASMTYAQLDDATDLLARRIASATIGRGERVAIALPRNASVIVAMIACLKAGVPYVPLDLDLPAERIEYILADAGAAAVLVDGSFRGGSSELLRIDVRPNAHERARGATLAHRPHPLDAAYVLYTSGSTGRPKGVVVGYAALSNYVGWAARAYLAGERRDALLASPFGFDLSVTATFCPLLVGGTVHVAERSSAQQIGAGLGRYDRLGLLKITPLHLRLLEWAATRTAAAELPPVVVLGGEALTHGHVRAWLARAPHTTFVNEYGPTETTVGASAFRIAAADGADDAPVPLGEPIDGAALYVVDENLHRVGAGATGEIAIGGTGVALGYHGRPGLTAQRFVPDPFASVPGARMYRTGDYARYEPNGELLYAGRRDDQVKIGGYRVELGEIAARLETDPDVARAAAIALDEDAVRVLVAFVVLRHGVRSCAAVSARFAQAVPDYMVPQKLVVLDELPATASGKIDRALLAALAREDGTGFVRAARGDEIVVDAATGAPLVPVANDAELALLRAVAQLHDAALRERPCATREPVRTTARAGVVAALGEHARAAAALYAHLTSRTHVAVVADAAELDALRPAVLLATTDTLTADVMEALYDRDDGAVPGLIIATSPSELLTAAKKNAVALLAARTPASGRRFLFPTFPFGAVERAEASFLGAHADDDAFRRAAAAGSGIVALYGHSSGLDLRISPRRWLCPVPPGVGGGGSAPPLCVELDRCTQARGMPSRADAWRTGEAVGVEALRARVFVALACCVVRVVEDDTIGADVHLGAALCTRGLVGTTIASWRPERYDREGMLLNGLLNDLAHGAHAGEAVAAFNASSDARAFGFRFCVLGDPEYRVGGLEALPDLPRRAATAPAAPSAAQDVTAARLALLREIVSGVAVPWPAEHATLVDELRELIDRRAAEPPSSGADSTAARLNERFALFMALAYRRPQELAAPFASFGDSSVVECLCHACGAAARSWEFRFGSPELSLFHRTCTRCTAQALVPAGAEMTVDCSALRFGRLRVRSPHAGARAYVQLVSATFDQRVPNGAAHASAALAWPLGPDGTLAREFVLTQAPPAGPLRCNVVAAWDETFAVWACNMPRNVRVGEAPREHERPVAAAR